MDVRRRRVGEVMQTEVAVLAPDERLDLADDVMQLGRVRHMPVLDAGVLVGVVSSRDVLAASLTKVLEFDPAHRRTFLHGVQIDEVMARDPVCADPETTLEEAARRMLEGKIGCLPVVKSESKSDRTLVGLLTETDLVRACLADARGPHEEEGSVMDVGEKLSEEVESLKRVRDELRVRIHLGKAEAKELWNETEAKLHELEAKAKSISAQAEEPLHDVGEAAKLLGEEIGDAYRRIREAL